ETGDMLLSRIGDTYHHEEKKEAAEKYYNAAINQYPDSEGASIAKLRLAKYSSGVSAYQEVHQKNVNKPIGDLALLEMANRYYEKGVYAMAIENLKGLIRKPTQVEIHNEAKNLYFRASEQEIRRLFNDNDDGGLIGFYQKAQPPLKKDIESEVLLMVADTFLKGKQYEAAITLYKAIKPFDLKRPLRGRLILNCARAYRAAGDDDAAERLIEENIKTEMEEKDRQGTTMLLAGLNRKKGDLKNAYRLYRSLVTAKGTVPDADTARAHLALGEISNTEKRYEEARVNLRRSIAIAEQDKAARPLLTLALVALGDSYFLENNYDQAAGFYRKGLDEGYGPEEKGYWQTRYRQALSLLELGSIQKAETILREISEGGDPLLQQKVQIKLGSLGLKQQLKKLPIWEEFSGVL
ncbi:MAG: tetratricopeptide repeat protein, partial [Pseudomonadota bacterium]